MTSPFISCLSHIELSSAGRPAYVISEQLLRQNLAKIVEVSRLAGVDIILAFKAYALWKTFPIFREYISSTTASSLYEARLAKEEFGSPAHTYSPAYTDADIEDIALCSSHLTFNSLSQYERFAARALDTNALLSIGLRINPKTSPVQTLLYNPCAPGTRFGIDARQMPDRLPGDIQGFHCHTLCESSAEEFEEVLKKVETDFAKWLPRLSWINFGGGHLMTREGYDRDKLVEILQGFRRRHPQLKVILEPGSAFAWRTGVLVSHVVDVVEDSNISTAILDVSFTCHMPDCLEMPYKPEVWLYRNGDEADASGNMPEKGRVVENGEATQEPTRSAYGYRLGGNSCLSGDYIGSWIFRRRLQVGDILVFEDMAHYTTVKTNMFNGIHHPSLLMLQSDGAVVSLRQYTYEDYLCRMD